MKRDFRSQAFGAVAGALLALSCSTTGTAAGELHEGSKPPQEVTLAWKADMGAPERGAISGQLPDGIHYAGRYYEVVQNVPEEVYANAWGGAEPYWPDWPVASPAKADQTKWETFAATYTGQVIATLTSDDRARSIRCRFNVTSPTAGLVRGGSGQCKLSDGGIIQNVVLSRE
jgi:hypothetical protein